jgi:hypothetical protein
MVQLFLFLIKQHILKKYGAVEVCVPKQNPNLWLLLRFMLRPLYSLRKSL